MLEMTIHTVSFDFKIGTHLSVPSSQHASWQMEVLISVSIAATPACGEKYMLPIVALEPEMESRIQVATISCLF